MKYKSFDCLLLMPPALWNILERFLSETKPYRLHFKIKKHEVETFAGGV